MINFRVAHTQSVTLKFKTGLFSCSTCTPVLRCWLFYTILTEISFSKFSFTSADECLQTQLPTQQCPRGLWGARTQTRAARSRMTSPAAEEPACEVLQAGCPISFWLADSRKAFPLIFPSPSPPSPALSLLFHKHPLPYQLLPTTPQQLTKPDNLTAAPRSEEQSLSSSSAEDRSSSSLEGRAASLPTPTSPGLHFQPCWLETLGTKTKVHSPKLSNSSTLPSHISVPGLQMAFSLPRKQQEGVPHITPAGRQQRAPHNHRCDLYTSIMFPS